MVRRLFWTLAAFLVAIASLSGCGDEKEVVITPEPAIKVTVSTIAPDTLDTGGMVTVEASVSGDATGPFTYSWMSEAGVFANAKKDSTLWTAPDDAGIYTLSVVVTNGKDVGIGSANVSVGTYIPAVSPFYRGAAYCATCHNGGTGGAQYAAWSQTGHATALESLQEIGMGMNAGCTPCHTVGTYGILPDTLHTIANGGFDETQVHRLAGVQCENCHGPGSDHPDQNFSSVGISMDAELCGRCHTDAHHPTFDEWQGSGHARIEEEAALRNSCAKCHNGLYADEFLNDPEHFTNPASNPTEAAAIVCASCHQPHGNDNPGNLRDASVTDRALPNSVLVERGGAGRLCMACHNGRRTSTNVNDQVNNGTAHFGPHRSVQGDMLAGVNAYQDVNATFPWTSSRHILVEDACVTCHTHPHAGDLDAGIPNFTGHSFGPTVEACAPCHGSLADFDDVRAKQDFDGDGSIEGVQSEIGGLLSLLEETIIAASATPEAEAILTASFEDSLGSPTVTTVDQRKAGYNWAFVSYDGSTGVHNANYSVQLLQQSILFLDPGALPKRAYILRQGV
jgi:hypothetical protein